MTEVTTGAVTPENKETPPAGGETTPQIPYERFKEVNDAKKVAEAKLAEYEAAQETARQAKLEKEGEYKTLIEEQKVTIAGLTEKITEWDSYKSARRQTLIEKIPEDKRKYADSMNLDTLEEFTAEYDNKTTGANTGKPGGIQNTGGYGGYQNPLEFASKDPQGYKKWKVDNDGIKIAF